MRRDEPTGVMAGLVTKVVAHTPFYMADGNTVKRKWKSNFTDRLGNTAVLTHVEFVTKKGKLNESVIRVEWDETHASIA